MQKKNPFLLPIILLFLIMVAGFMLIVVLASNRNSLRDVKEVVRNNTASDSSSVKRSANDQERVMTVVRDEESGETRVKDVTDEIAQVDANLIAAGFIDKDKTYVRHPASEVIINAATDSGSFQVADRLFRLPASFKTLTDNGVRIVTIDGATPMDTDDFLLYRNSSHELICVYEDIVFGVNVIDMDIDNAVEPGEKIAVTQMEAVSVWEDADNAYMRKDGEELSGHLFFPGGVSIGSTLDDVQTVYGKYGYQTTQLVKDAAVLYTYGYEGLYDTTPMNMVSFRVKGNEDVISKIQQGRNGS